MFSSGNEKVDRIGMIDFSGNIIPPIWFKTIVKDTGKPYLLAMMILADIIYWYRPTIERSEETGQIIAVKKKFSADLLQRSYSQFVEQFGETKQVIRRALEFLEDKHLIRRELRTVERNGNLNNNVMFIDIDVEGIYRITYPDTPGIKNNTRVVSKITPASYQNCDECGIENDITPGIKNDRTNTKNIYTENSTKSITETTNNIPSLEKKSIDPSIEAIDGLMDSRFSEKRDYEQEVKNKIGYEYILKMNERLEEKLDKGEMDLDTFGKRFVNLNELEPYISFIAKDMARTNYESITVEGKQIPWKEYVSKLEAISFGRLDAVIKKFNERTGEIRSRDSYLRALLYNMDSIIEVSGKEDYN